MRIKLIIAASVFVVAASAITRLRIIHAQTAPAVFYEYVTAVYGNHNLKKPTGLAYITGYAGNYLVIADTGNNRIEALNPAGSLTTLAGTGTAGNANGSLTSAQFNTPTGVSGVEEVLSNMHFTQMGIPPNTGLLINVTDTSNFTIRQICFPLHSVSPQPLACSGNGYVSILAGSGSNALTDGTGTAASLGYAVLPDSRPASGSTVTTFVDTSNSAIRQISNMGVVTTQSSTTPGYQDGPLSTAMFAYPASITSDGLGNLLIADTGNSSIRKLTSSGMVSTIAGTGAQGYLDGPGLSAQFAGPIQALYNPSDTYTYVSDSQNNCIRRIDSSGNVTTYAGTTVPGYQDGPVASAQFSQPSGLALNGSLLYVSDTLNDVIRQIDLSTGQVTTLIN